MAQMVPGEILMHIRFTKYFKGQWNYPYEMGVGLKLSNTPIDKEKFIDDLQGESCNPLATRRILEQLIEKGYYLTTCASSLDFDRIGDNLKRNGVDMEIIPPIKNPTDGSVDAKALCIYWGEDIDSISFIDEKEKEEVVSRLKIFRKQMEELPYTLGPYKRI